VATIGLATYKERKKNKMRKIFKKLAIFVAVLMALSLAITPLSAADIAPAINVTTADDCSGFGETIIFEEQPFGNNHPTMLLLIDALHSLETCGRLYVTDTYYNGTGNERGNFVEAIRDADGKMTIYVWPVTDGPANANSEIIRALQYVLRPGDELVFHEGLYGRILSPRWIDVTDYSISNTGGTPEDPIIIRGYGYPQARPHFHAMDGNVMEITKSNVIFDFMEFSSGNVGAIRFDGLAKGAGPDINGNFVPMGVIDYIPRGAHPSHPVEPEPLIPVTHFQENVTIQNSVIGRFPGQYAIRMQYTGREYHNMSILYNDFINHIDASMYIGHPDYRAPIFGMTVRGNFFEHYYMHVFSPQSGSQVGYTMQAKRGVLGLVFENNLIMNPWGPALFFYGAYPHFEYPHPLVPMSYIRNNVVIGGRSDAILVGGGPAITENNITFGANWGVRVHDYGGRYRYENVWRNMYFFNNFGANASTANFYVAANFRNPAINIGRPVYGSAIDLGDVVYSGNVSVAVSEQLRDGLPSLLDIRTRPAGFDGLMAAINANYGSGVAFTEAEVVAMMTTYLNMYVIECGCPTDEECENCQCEVCECDYDCVVQPPFPPAVADGFSRTNISRIDGVSTPMHTAVYSDPLLPVGGADYIEYRLWFHPTDVCPDTNVALQVNFIQALSDGQPAFTAATQNASLQFRGPNAPQRLFWFRSGGAGAVGLQWSARTSYEFVFRIWPSDNTWSLTVHDEDGAQLTSGARQAIGSSATPPDFTYGIASVQLLVSGWHTGTGDIAAYFDYPTPPGANAPFPGELREGFTRELIETTGNGLQHNIVYEAPIMPGAGGYVEYRVLVHPTLADTAAALQLRFHPADEMGNPTTGSAIDFWMFGRYHGWGGGNATGFRFARGGGAGNFPPGITWEAGRSYEIVFRLNPAGWLNIQVLEDGVSIHTQAGQAYNAITGTFADGLARVEILVAGANAENGIAKYVDFLTPVSVPPVLPEFGWSIFNNGPGGTQYPRPNPGLAASGTIRMWAQLDGVNAPVYFDAVDTIVALDQDGENAMEFVTVNRMWVAGTGWVDYFNMVNVNKNGQWQYINLTITVYGETVHVLLANALFEPPVEYVTVTFVVEAGAVGVYAATTTTVVVPAGEEIPASAIPNTEARTGFYFAGWYPTNPAGFVTTEDVTFTARFNPLFHNVTFEAGNGGELVPAAGFGLVVNIRDGFTFWADRVPTPVPNAGYAFIGWYPADPAGFVIRESMTFTALFAVPQIVSVAPNPTVVERDGEVQIVVTTLGMPDGAWVDLNVAWHPGLSIVGGSRFYIANNQAIITVAAADNAQLGQNGFSVAARTSGDWGSVVIIDSQSLVIEVI